MDLAGNMLSEKSQGKTSATRSHLHVESKKVQWTSELQQKKKNKESDTDTENKLLVTTGEKEGEGQWGKRGYYKIIWNHERETSENCKTLSNQKNFPFNKKISKIKVSWPFSGCTIKWLHRVGSSIDVKTRNVMGSMTAESLSYWCWTKLSAL